MFAFNRWFTLGSFKTKHTVKKFSSPISEVEKIVASVPVKGKNNSQFWSGMSNRELATITFLQISCHTLGFVLKHFL